MFYYDHNIGDFAIETRGLTYELIGIYISLLDWYASTQKPITSEWLDVAYQGETKCKAIALLKAFFVKREEGYVHLAIEKQIIAFEEMSKKRSEAGKKGGRRKKASPSVAAEYDEQALESNCLASASVTNNQEPITNNHIDVVNDTTCHMSEEPSDDGLFGEEQVQKTGQTGAPNCPTKQIVDLYHQILPELPKVTLITTARQSSTRSRWRDLYGAKDFETLEQGLNVFREYFEIVKSRDFLMGRCKPSGGREVPFRADYDWLMKQANFLKVCEGKYANARRK